MFALDGQVQIHDPSTIMQCDGKYYTYGTGGTTLVSDDGWLRTLDGQGIPSIETPAPLLLGGECQSVPPSTSLALDEQAGLRAHVEPTLGRRTRPPYAVARYDVGSLEVRLRYVTWRRGREELRQKLRLMAL